MLLSDAIVSLQEKLKDELFVFAIEAQEPTPREKQEKILLFVRETTEIELASLPENWCGFAVEVKAGFVGWQKRPGTEWSCLKDTLSKTKSQCYQALMIYELSPYYERDTQWWIGLAGDYPPSRLSARR